MGKTNDILQGYLDNNVRFADFVNGAYHQGRQVLHAEDLTEASERYNIPVPKKEDGTPKKRIQRYRDLKKLYQSGSMIRVLSMENQNLVDYSMPIRCMYYDALEYQKQISTLKEKNKKDTGFHPTKAEWLCGLKKTDRLIPAYTLCLYHGTDAWDGPRTLKDMMNFGSDTDSMSDFFHDYPMKLYCINEEHDFTVFQTSLRELFTAMHYRNDPERLQKLVNSDEKFHHLDAETVEVLSVMLNAPQIWKERAKYMVKNNDENEEEVYDMCYALQKWREEDLARGRTEGRTEGLSEGLSTGIKSFIELCEEFGITMEQTINRLMQKFSIEQTSAEEYVSKYWMCQK